MIKLSKESCDVKMATVNELDDSAPYVEISAESREAIASIPNVINNYFHAGIHCISSVLICFH
jgi:hypothetical protein